MNRKKQIAVIKGSKPVAEDMEKWANKMGFNFKGKKALDVLVSMPKEQAAIWQHIIKQVKPRQEVELIKKNILLAKFENIGLLNVQNSTVQSEKEEILAEKEEKKRRDNTKIKTLRKTIAVNNQLLTEKIKKKNHLKSALEDHNSKRILLEYKAIEIKDVMSRWKAVFEIMRFFGDRSSHLHEFTSAMLAEKDKFVYSLDCVDQIKMRNCMDELLSYYKSYYNGENKKNGAGNRNLNTERYLVNMITETTLNIPPKAIHTFCKRVLKEVETNVDKLFDRVEVDIQQWTENDDDDDDDDDDNNNSELLDKIRETHVTTFCNLVVSHKNIRKLKSDIKTAKDALVKQMVNEIYSSTSKIADYDHSYVSEKINSFICFRCNKIREASTKQKDMAINGKLVEETKSFDMNVRQLSQLNYDYENLPKKIADKAAVLLKRVERILSDTYTKPIEDLSVAVLDMTTTELAGPCFNKEWLERVVKGMKENIKDEVEIFLQIPISKLQGMTTDECQNNQLGNNSKSYCIDQIDNLYDEFEKNDWNETVNGFNHEINNVSNVITNPTRLSTVPSDSKNFFTNIHEQEVKLTNLEAIEKIVSKILHDKNDSIKHCFENSDSTYNECKSMASLYLPVGSKEKISLAERFLVSEKTPDNTLSFKDVLNKLT